MAIESIIRNAFTEVLDDCGLNSKEDLTDTTILLDSGLDSLGFATLVAKLEEDLGYDPFTMVDQPVYPRTYKEFIDIYEKFKDFSTR